MIARRPSIVDLSRLDDRRLCAALRGLTATLGPSARCLVLDLGERRSLTADCAAELVRLCQAVAARDGRCAVVAEAPLAAQLSFACPGGLVCAADRRSATLALRADGAHGRATLDSIGDETVVGVSGSVDLDALRAIAPVLERAVALAAPGARIVIDLAGVRFADVAGLRRIASALRRCLRSGADARVANAPRSVRRPAGLLGWETDLPGVDDEAGPARSARPTALQAAIAEIDDDRDAAIATDLAGNVTYWNAAAERLYGWSAAEALGRPISELTVGPEDQELAAQIMESVRETGVWQGEFETRRRDGATVLTHVRDTLVVDRQGRPVGLLGTSHAVRGPRRAPAVAR